MWTVGQSCTIITSIDVLIAYQIKKNAAYRDWGTVGRTIFIPTGTVQTNK